MAEKAALHNRGLLCNVFKCIVRLKNPCAVLVKKKKKTHAKMHWERNQAEMLMGTLGGGQYVACTKISFDFFFSLFFSHLK